MAKPDLLIPAPMHPRVAAALAAFATVHQPWQADDPAAALAAVAPRVRGLAVSTLAGTVDAAMLDRFPALEIVASFGVGYERVDAAAAAARDVIVTNTPGVLDEEVADLTLGLLLATLRQIPQADHHVRAGRWPEGAFPLSPSLRGRRVGLIGMGGIGRAIARRLEGFAVPIAYHSRHRRDDLAYAYHASPIALAEASDVLIAIVPGGAATRHLIDASVLRALGPAGVLINVARGSVVDEAALIAALEAGTLLAAGLDVFADEPHVPAALTAHPRCVLLPHIGSASEVTRAAMADRVVANLEAWFTGAPVPDPVAEAAALARRAQAARPA
ncbi:2-hydroxyacid dehydrogenase [Sphingomonas morindae]|uniref:2-hydroxyacid dehydrogenase n=1 Tax=Sphingomonas morindae TaxID=1541170 RepID=A0ABY4XDH7_9SPHN|nr:2-hydroxyacid dehydrogenase [Sphingomonas morindae]USI74985.1 2-hydroxyacid dehydrogenase [Sphingomonas morindae]